MTRWTSSIALIALLLVAASPALAGQIDPAGDYDTHLDVILETALIETTDRFTTDIGFDAFSATDDLGDGEFSTGETPERDLVAEMDIARFSLLVFGEHPFPELTGDELCAAPEFGDAVRRFCSNPISDPAAFANGTHISTFQFAGPPGPFNANELCEWVVWISDPANPNTFQVLDAFPNDPAGGTNTAIGLRSDFGEVSTFRLELTDDGFFQDVPTDTVAIFEGDHLSLLTPLAEFGQPAAVNGYTFCTGGQFSAVDSVADTTGLFTPAPATLRVAPPPTTTTTTTITTTTARPPTTTTAGATETTQASAGAGGFPWPGLVFGGLLLMGVGVWLAVRKQGCEEELRAWQAAQRVCDDATKALDEARKRAADAEKARDQAEDDVEKLCEAMPAACWEGDPADTYVEDPDVAGSRIDRLDLFVKRAWSKALWKRYRDGELTAEQVEDAWGEDPPADFDEDIRKEYEKATTKKSQLDKALEKAEKALEEAEAAVEPAEAKAEETCDKAAKAKATYDACMKKPTPVPAGGAATGTGTEPGSTPGSTPGSEPSEPQPCSPESARREGASTTLRVNVPIRLEPMISGGHAHAASEQADEIGAALGQAEVGAQAIGRLFSFGGAGKVVTDFSAGAAADLAVGAVSEAKGIPIPTNIPTAVANVTEVIIKAGRVSITKVLDLQERRLPDVDLSIRRVKATYVLTCTRMEICRNGEWVADGTRLTVEAGEPRNFGTKKHAALTWAEAQEELAEYARRRFQPELERSLKKMADFQKKCAEGG